MLAWTGGRTFLGAAGSPLVLPSALLGLTLLGSMPGCRCDAPASDGEAAPTASPTWDVGRAPPPRRAGMIWIPPGTLLAGTKPGQLPRVADEELPGTPIELEGFFIDEFNYPAEPGAIPETGITQARARQICEEQDKRLCTELEWERACKGPKNTTYDYGERYDASVCGTGSTDALAPNGVNTQCRSGFGVRDLHGSAWNWTSSAWRRGDEGDARVAVRGGNGVDGELVGRCANGRGLTPDQRDPGVGVRCCAGKANEARVALAVQRGSELAYRPFDPRIAEQLEQLIPEEIQQLVADRPKPDHFKVERLWMWRPIGNEELVIGGGCAHPPVHDACGVMVARLSEGKAEGIAFVASDWWIPTVGEHEDPRTLFVYGGDIGGAFRKPMIYAWGRIQEGDKHRKKRGGWTSPLR